VSGTYHPDYKRDRHAKCAHVALHTSAAPSIYPGVENDGHVMIDGGVWANNRIMNALVDVLACFDVPRENIRILSSGTRDDVFVTDEALRKAIPQFSELPMHVLSASVKFFDVLGFEVADHLLDNALMMPRRCGGRATRNGC
jgi:patatin-like phospholipase/acyl hydrolase